MKQDTKPVSPVSNGINKLTAKLAPNQVNKGVPATGTPQIENSNPRPPERTRDLFGVQLEVTSLLLEAERRKLSVLQRELRGALTDGGSLKQKEKEAHSLTSAIARIQAQSNVLEQEYRQAAVEVLRSSNTRGSGKSNRSQPAFGLKQTWKARPTIFGTVTADQTPKDSNRKSPPQTTVSTSSPIQNGIAGEHNSSQESIRDSILPEKSLVYKDGNLIAGSLEALTQHLVPTDTYSPDRTYVFAFLLSSRLYVKPHDLLGDVCRLCVSQQNLDENSPVAKERASMFCPRLVQLLSEWMETFPYDYRDERMMAHVRQLTQRIVTLEPNLRKEVSQILQTLLSRLTALEKYEEFLQKNGPEVPVSDTSHINTTDIIEVCPSSLILSQQLTHIELERLSFIGPEEFVQAFAKDSPHLDTSFKDMKKTRNLESYIQWFNRLSYFVATQVCMHVKKKQRVKIIEYWIEVARECFNIGNFNSLMAIIAGLNMSPVARLKKTWNKVQSAKFSVLEHQMDPSSNFSSYRSTLKAAMWRSAGATDERQRIVIPFFSLLVKDLYFLNEGCASRLPSNGNINFEKFWQLAKQVTEFIAWKQVTCPFDKHSQTLTYLQRSSLLTENGLALASFECEHADNNMEKERYKSLKAEAVT